MKEDNFYTNARPSLITENPNASILNFNTMCF